MSGPPLRVLDHRMFLLGIDLWVVTIIATRASIAPRRRARGEGPDHPASARSRYGAAVTCRRRRLSVWPVQAIGASVAAMSDQPAIVVEGLVKHFGDVHALDGIDLTVRPGTVYGLLGPNGAGKTTAVRVLTTIIAPDAGQGRGARARRRQAGPQGPGEHRPGRPVRRGRRAAHRSREPAAGRPVDPAEPEGRAGPGPTSCSSASRSPTPPTARSRPTPVACGGASTSRHRSSTDRSSCSSTSRPPGSTRGVATISGR